MVKKSNVTSSKHNDSKMCQRHQSVCTISGRSEGGGWGGGGGGEREEWGFVTSHTHTHIHHHHHQQQQLWLQDTKDHRTLLSAAWDLFDIFIISPPPPPPPPHQNDSCIKMGSDNSSHFNVSSAVRDKVTKTVSANHRRAEAELNHRGPSICLLALTLGQTAPLPPPR